MHPSQQQFMDPEEVNRQMGLQQLQNTINSHDQVNFFNGLNYEDLITVRRTLTQIRDSGDPKLVINFWVGWLTSTLSTKFGHCLACNTKHDTATLIDGPTL